MTAFSCSSETYMIEAFKQRQQVTSIVIDHAQEVQERWMQFGVLSTGMGIYFGIHRHLSRTLLSGHSPMLPQVFSIVPAMAFVYCGGLYVRFKTLKREGLLS